MGHFNKQMYMVWLNAKFIDFKSIFSGNFSKRRFAKFFDLFEFERVPSIFAFPNKVKCILSNSMLEVCKFHFLSSCTKFKNTAHAKTNVLYACADSGARISYYSQNLLRNRKLALPRAKALGILCM